MRPLISRLSGLLLLSASTAAFADDDTEKCLSAIATDTERSIACDRVLTSSGSTRRTLSEGRSVRQSAPVQRSIRGA